MVFYVTNSVTLKNILVLLKLFYNNTFHGVFNRPFFKHKRNRYGFIFVLVVIYIGYFYLNIIEIEQLGRGLYIMDDAEYLYLSKITMSSFFNVILMISVIIAIFIHRTISLNRNALFFAKTLPFSEKEVIMSYMIFKLSVAIMLFEIIIIIMVPALKLMSTHLFVMLFVFITMHALFIAVFFIMEMIYAVISRTKGIILRNILSFLVDITFIFLLFTHFLTIRFTIDRWVGMQAMTVAQMVSIVFMSSVMIGSLALLLNYTYIVKDDMQLKPQYFKVGIPSFHIILPTTIPAIVRNKNFFYFIGLFLVVSLSAFIQAGRQGMLESLVFIMPLFGFIAITYADATNHVRKVFHLYRIKPIIELSSLVLSTLVLVLPTLWLGFVQGEGFILYVYSINIFIGAVLIGFLFPKSESNVNETIATLLLMIVVIVLSLLVNMKGALYPCLFLLLLMLYVVIKKEYEVAK